MAFDAATRIQGAGPNEAVVAAMVAAEPVLVDVCTAREAIDAFDDGAPLLLHAGPPIDVAEALASVPPMRGALFGALLFEGRAGDPDEARALLAAGAVTLSPAHHHGAVGPLAGVIPAGMPGFLAVDEASGARAFVPLNEGLGKVLRYGAYEPSVLERLRWMADVLGPTLRRALQRHGPLPLRPVVRDALGRGDECHNRNKAATAIFLQQLGPHIVRAADDQDTAAACLEFIGGNEHFFLNLSMAHSKCTTEAVAAVPGSSVVTAIASNGVRLGVRVAGTGDRWHTAPAPRLEDGRWLGDNGPADAAPLVGDSFVSEVNGIGAFAGACAPGITAYVGGTVAELAASTEAMYAITCAEHPGLLIPYFDFRGVPIGIDVHAVARTGIRPAVNAGVAGLAEGVGQVGAGRLDLPLEPFVAASQALAAEASHA